MGISDGLQGSGVEVDCSVGTIVWVRRRNGSWWPGRILGANELSDSHIMSPRSGTPVKLLGREDASVDWYNLEKSKRVKAFRCGEFDDCIERAESSQGAPIKKREKYARREDAILHALELEKQLLEKRQQKLGSANHASNKVPIGMKKELGIPAGNIGNNNCKLITLKSQPPSKGLDSGEESMENPLYAQNMKHGKQLGWQDDNGEVIPRMRGLQDIGLRTAKSKRKLSASVSSEGPRRFFSVDNHAHVLPSASRGIIGAKHASSNKNSLTFKRKRTQGALIEESVVKKRDRRRPIVQVLKSSAKLPVSSCLQSNGDTVSISMEGEQVQTGVMSRAKRSQCVYLPAASNDSLDNTEIPLEQKQISPPQFETGGHLHPESSTEDTSSSGMMEEAESDSSERGYLTPAMDEDTTVFSDSTPILTDIGPRNSGKFVNNYQVQRQTGSISSEELDESAVTAHISHIHPRDQTGAGTSDAGVSEWQLKGKRNIRNLLKRPMEMDGDGPNGLIRGTHMEGRGRYRPKQRALGQGFCHGTEDLRYDYDADDLIDRNPMHDQVLGFGNRRYPVMLKSTSNDIDSEEDLVWDVNGLSQSSLKGYWDESEECFNPLYVGHRSGTRREHMLVDVDLKVQASYQGEHVPLVSLMSRLNGKAIIGHPVQIETLEDGASDLLLSTNDDFEEEPTENDGSTALTPVWRTARRTVMHRARPHPPKSSEHKSSKKLLKKVSLPSQKTRTLSSIATQQKLSKPANQKTVNGLIKPEETGPTTITCIPVKLVFSRLTEAIGRSPPRTANPSVPANDDTVRKPS